MVDAGGGPIGVRAVRGLLGAAWPVFRPGQTNDIREAITHDIPEAIYR